MSSAIVLVVPLLDNGRNTNVTEPFGRHFEVESLMSKHSTEIVSFVLAFEIDCWWL